jgi:ABC-type nitrate/sulfonate/bicarbonate transport system substrate-binding protein
MKARIFAGIVAVIVVAVAAESADKVRIGVSNYNLSNLTVGVAQNRDFFKQEGIDAEIIRMNPNVATMALVSGDVDYTTLIGSVIGANLKGAKLKMIACSQDRTPLAFVGKPELKAVKDLKGKTIAVGSYGSTPDIVARMVVKHFGLDPETDIKVLALGSDGARLRAERGCGRRDHRGAAGRFRRSEDGVQYYQPRGRHFPISVQRLGNQCKKN